MRIIFIGVKVGGVGVTWEQCLWSEIHLSFYHLFTLWKEILQPRINKKFFTPSAVFAFTNNFCIMSSSPFSYMCGHIGKKQHLNVIMTLAEMRPRLSLDFLASILTDGRWWWDSRLRVWSGRGKCQKEQSVFLKCISQLYFSTVFLNWSGGGNCQGQRSEQVWVPSWREEGPGFWLQLILLAANLLFSNIAHSSHFVLDQEENPRRANFLVTGCNTQVQPS